MFWKISLFAMALLSLSAPLSASVIYVSGDQTGTWAADTVIVTAEVRVPPGQSLTIQPGVEVLFSVYCKLIVDNGATLLAVGTPADSIRFDVLPPDTAWHGIRFLSASDSSRLEYCILTNGSATGSYQDQQGGAVYCSFSSPIISHNTISENFAFYSGGGICCSNSNPTITANTISGNSGGTGSGGAIFCWSNSNPSIINNTICNNSTAGHGGGISCFMDSNPIISGNIINQNSGVDGGGIDCVDNSSPTISGNTIGRNSAQVNGGGIFCYLSSNPRIDDNIISGNSAGQSFYPITPGQGGAIFCGSNSSPTISGNTITGNSAAGIGGGIYCSSSSPSINDNIISANRAYCDATQGNDGGGIYCTGSNATICGNTIIQNSATGDGGGISCLNSSPTINGNTINENEGFDGGGINCLNSSPTIIGNSINENEGFDGGGINCLNSSPIIICNTINGNTASDENGNGGGIMCYMGGPIINGNIISGNLTNGVFSYCGGISCLYSSPTISGNTISENSNIGYEAYGGGISCTGGNPTISDNTISSNTADYGGGISSTETSSIIMVNSIIWANEPDQIYGTPSVTYSDIQGGYTGTGNINLWPAFVDTAQDDYRLQWGSPCIDTGDPNPIYNDPDGSRADMGAWYYDQSMPVRVLLTPYNQPIQIPVSGGSFLYAIQATNISTSTLSVLVWCNATLPSGAGTAPLLGPATISLASGQTLSRLRTQVVPASAPAGMYHYNAYAVAAGDTSEDSFTFVKLGAGGWGLDAGGWVNAGEEFIGGTPSVASASSGATPTMEVMPNPFNPSTAISFELREASFVKLKVYDTAGRLVTELINGWRDAGAHQITFDGSDLPSGIYFAKLEAGDYSQVQKLMLLK